MVVQIQQHQKQQCDTQVFPKVIISLAPKDVIVVAKIIIIKVLAINLNHLLQEVAEVMASNQLQFRQQTEKNSKSHSVKVFFKWTTP